MRTGVRQDCVLSPLLLLVALDWVMRTAFDRKRVVSLLVKCEGSTLEWF